MCPAVPQIVITAAVERFGGVVGGVLGTVPCSEIYPYDHKKDLSFRGQGLDFQDPEPPLVQGEMT